VSIYFLNALGATQSTKPVAVTDVFAPEFRKCKYTLSSELVESVWTANVRLGLNVRSQDENAKAKNVQKRFIWLAPAPLLDSIIRLGYISFGQKPFGRETFVRSTQLWLRQWGSIICKNNARWHHWPQLKANPFCSLRKKTTNVNKTRQLIPGKGTAILGVTEPHWPTEDQEFAFTLRRSNVFRSNGFWPKDG
jgi:hypothetical protein